MKDLVTAIITTHNRKNLLVKAIDSVLKQTYKNIELIIVDDASTDNSQSYIKEMFANVPILYIYIENSKGGNHARNQGILKATGKYISFLDDDDEWLPIKIDKQVKYLTTHKDFDVVSCNRIIEQDFSERKPINKNTFPQEGDLKEAIWYNNCLVSSTLMLKRNYLINIGMFDEKLMYWQDYELMMRAAQNTKIGIILEPLVLYRAFKRDKVRLTNNIEGWEKAIEYINQKHAITIANLSNSARIRYNVEIAIDGLYRAENNHDLKRRIKYLYILFKAKPSFKSFIKYTFNITNLRFWKS